jgi:dTMP kinase
MSPDRCFGAPPPGLDISRLSGRLVVIEGPDSSGRSTHVDLLARWIEEKGFAVAQVGLKRSHLVSTELDKAKRGNVLSPRTMSLFYATDFYDQMENVLVPALRAGAVVLADRYVFTLMARDLVRGADPDWVDVLYSRAIIPEAVFLLRVRSAGLVQRALRSHGSLDYWEAGMDMGLSRDWYDCFVRYQKRLGHVFRSFEQRFGFHAVDAERPVEVIQADLRKALRPLLEHQRG